MRTRARGAPAGVPYIAGVRGRARSILRRRGVRTDLLELVLLQIGQAMRRMARLDAVAAGLDVGTAAGNKPIRWRPARNEGDIDQAKPEYQDVMRSYSAMAQSHRSQESASAEASQRPTSWGYSKEWLREVAGISDPAAVDELLAVACGGGCPFAFGAPLGALPSEGNCVVDLGCGGGHDLAIASKLVGPRGTLVGIDLTQAMLDRAANTVEKFGDRRPLDRGDLICTPIDQVAAFPRMPAAAADVTISNGVFNLFVDKQAGFDAAFYCTKPGGHFLLTDVVVEPARCVSPAGSSPPS